MGILKNNLLSFMQGASNSAAANVSAPVDGIAWLLRKAGIDIQNPVGGSDWMRSKGLTAEPGNKLAGILGESLGGVSPMLASAKAPQIASALLKGGENLAVPSTMNPQTGAIVWHGSPHKFDKFDSSKIGTGEGAQAYGHGLYLAEAPDVAKQYRDMLSSSEYRLKGGGQYDPANPTHIAAAVLDEYGGDASKAIKGLTAKINQNKQVRGGEQWNKDLLQQLNTIKAGKAAQIETVTDGALYKVDLPDEHIAKMLDWDKPLSQQHPDVQKMLEPLGYSSKAQVSQYEDDLLAALTGDASAPLKQIRDPMGSDIARGGGLFDSKAQIEKAKRLKELGIPGIRYLDGGSRGTGGGTSNFVVFPGNENLLQILERNGQPVNQLQKLLK